MMMIMMPDDELLATNNPNKQATSYLTDLNIPAPPNDACWALVEWCQRNIEVLGKKCPTATLSTKITNGLPEHGPLSYKMQCHSSGHRRFSMKRDKSVMTKYCGRQTSFR